MPINSSRIVDNVKRLKKKYKQGKLIQFCSGVQLSVTSKEVIIWSKNGNILGKMGTKGSIVFHLDPDELSRIIEEALKET